MRILSPIYHLRLRLERATKWAAEGHRFAGHIHILVKGGGGEGGGGEGGGGEGGGGEGGGGEGPWRRMDGVP